MNTRSELDRLLRTGPFHLALRAAIDARGLALHRVRHRLAERGVRVGVTSLSYWQQGIRRPTRPESLRAVRALEEVLGLREDALTGLLQSTDQPGGGMGERAYPSLLDAADALQRLLDELGAPADGGLHTVVHFEQVHIGSRRELLRRESQQVVRAHGDDVDRYVAIHYGDRGCDAGRVRLRTGDNCRVGEVRRDAATGLVAAELLFDTRLRTGDTHVFGYAFEDGTAGVCREYVRGFRFGGGDYVLRVRFDDEVRPLRCRRFARAAPGARPTAVRDLPLRTREPGVHLAEQGVEPGIVGIAWDWR